MSSEFTKRIFTSIILLLGIFSYVIYANEDYFLGLIIIIGIFCYGEWIVLNSLLLKKFNKGFRPYITEIFKSKNFYKYSSIYLFGFIYFLLILPTSAFYLRFEINLNFLLLILIICICSDIGGYIFGKTIGGKKLTKISPNKTISGSIGSFILPLIFISLLNIEIYLIELNLINILFILFVSLICQLGDLFFSYFKRLNKKKNTSNLLPGHGGLIDRIDGLVIVLPIVFLIKFMEIF